jgi:hypothetical protein
MDKILRKRSLRGVRKEQKTQCGITVAQKIAAQQVGRPQGSLGVVKSDKDWSMVFHSGRKEAAGDLHE